MSLPTFTGHLKKEKDCIQAIIDQAFPHEAVRSSIFTQQRFITFKKPKVSG